MTQKIFYVIDTSVLVNDPSSILSFPNSTIVLPIVVIEELDKVKKLPNETGRNARVVIRKIDELFVDSNKPIKLPNNSSIIIDISFNKGIGSDPSYGDSRILSCAVKTKKANKTAKVILVSRDINLRIRAKSLGLSAQDYDKDSKDVNELYSGVRTIVDLDGGLVLRDTGSINCKNTKLKDLNENEFVLFSDKDNKGIASGRKIGEKIYLVKEQPMWGIKTRSKEQLFAVDLLMDPSLPLVTLVGTSGSGKTLISLAASLELMIEKKKYDKLVIYRPITTVDEGMGFLPGPQPLDAKILTPSGWTTMGDIKIGSEVISRDGMPTKVLGVYPKGTKSVYKVTTTDGTSTECCGDHLWYTETFENKKRGKKGSVKTTKEIMDTLTKNGKVNHFLPRNEPVHFNKYKLPLSPYTLGTLLGDGSIGDYVCISSVDFELPKRVSSEIAVLNCSLTNSGNDINYNIKSYLYNNKPARPVKITNIETGKIDNYPSIGMAQKSIQINRSTLHDRCQRNVTIGGLRHEYLECEVRWQNPVKEILHKLGLSNKKAWDKFIPDIYKYASLEDRIALLQGLMDTDGTIKKRGEASYCTTSKQLALDMIELVRSLGGRATLCSRDRIGKVSYINDHEVINKRISYEFTVSLPKNINPFFISRKASRHKCAYIHRVGIKSIEYIGEKLTQCILIENPEHLYITDDFIVTHNTLEEKLEPFMQPIMDGFELLFRGNNPDKWKTALAMYKEKGKIEFNALSYIRGRSIANSIILIDEAQNLTSHQMKTILTRVGENTKIIITGDIFQIDNQDLDPVENGLTYVIEKFKKLDLAGHITFTKGERSDLATKAAEIL